MDSVIFSRVESILRDSTFVDPVTTPVKVPDTTPALPSSTAEDQAAFRLICKLTYVAFAKFLYGTPPVMAATKGLPDISGDFLARTQAEGVSKKNKIASLVAQLFSSPAYIPLRLSTSTFTKTSVEKLDSAMRLFIGLATQKKEDAPVLFEKMVSGKDKSMIMAVFLDKDLWDEILEQGQIRADNISDGVKEKKAENTEIFKALHDFMTGLIDLHNSIMVFKPDGSIIDTASDLGTERKTFEDYLAGVSQAANALKVSLTAEQDSQNISAPWTFLGSSSTPDTGAAFVDQDGVTRTPSKSLPSMSTSYDTDVFMPYYFAVSLLGTIGLAGKAAIDYTGAAIKKEAETGYSDWNKGLALLHYPSVAANWMVNHIGKAAPPKVLSTMLSTLNDSANAANTFLSTPLKALMSIGQEGEDKGVDGISGKSQLLADSKASSNWSYKPALAASQDDTGKIDLTTRKVKAGALQVLAKPDWWSRQAFAIGAYFESWGEGGARKVSDIYAASQIVECPIGVGVASPFAASISDLLLSIKKDKAPEDDQNPYMKYDFSQDADVENMINAMHLIFDDLKAILGEGESEALSEFFKQLAIVRAALKKSNRSGKIQVMRMLTQAMTCLRKVRATSVPSTRISWLKEGYARSGVSAKKKPAERLGGISQMKIFLANRPSSSVDLANIKAAGVQPVINLATAAGTTNTASAADISVKENPEIEGKK